MGLFYLGKFRTRLFRYMICMLLVSLTVGCGNSDKSSSDLTNGENKAMSSDSKNISLEVSSDNILTTIKDIAHTSHPFGTDEEKEVAKYLKDKLDSFGYEVIYQDFEVFDLGEDARSQLFEPDIDDFLNIYFIDSKISKGSARNVIAKQESFDKDKKTLYVTCHYDTTRATTGVYDNSTGVSSVLEIARVLQNYDSDDFNVIFAFFSGEEYCRMGSRYYLSQLSSNERDNILGAINIDMVGYSGFEYKDFPKIGDVEILLSPFVEKDALEIAFNAYFENKYNVDNKLGGMSDDLPFAKLGVPTISLSDKNFGVGFEIEGEDFNTQFAPVDGDKLSDLCDDIYLFIKNIDLSKF